MTPYVLLSAVLPFYTDDPAPGLLRSSDSVRSMECAWTDPATVRRDRPGALPPERPRGDYVERSALVCTARFLRPGLRSPADEAVLDQLDVRTREIAAAAGSLRPELAERTWLVEAFHPSAPVTGKITFATKAALMDQGLAVSDRLPTLAAGDVLVLTRLPPDQAYPAACARWSANGTLREGDALLAVLIRDPRETALHGGVCAGGRWEWIR